MLQLENTKTRAFEFFVDQLVKWYKEQNQSTDFNENDLSRLKVLKLHFFVSASKTNEQEDGLLTIFDNFWALPYGHVESDIYSNLDNLELFKINSQRLRINKDYTENYFSSLETSTKENIVNSFNLVKQHNIDLINYMAVDLVELSHSWYSWKSIYSLARSFQKYSMKIPNEIIKAENKIYRIDS